MVKYWYLILGGNTLKKLLWIGALSALLLAACGDSGTNDTKENSAEVKEDNNEVAETTEEVIEHFKVEGLEIGEISDLENKEFGNLREEGKRILIPSLGEDAGGRLFKFKDKEGLEEAKSYYDELGNSGPMFYSHTHANGLFLLQMNGDMEDAEFEKFKTAMDEALK